MEQKRLYEIKAYLDTSVGVKRSDTYIPHVVMSHSAIYIARGQICSCFENSILIRSFLLLFPLKDGKQDQVSSPIIHRTKNIA